MRWNGLNSRFFWIGIPVLLVFVILFAYSSLNLKMIDLGYRQQELVQMEKRLIEEIDRLKAEKAQLLNLDRVERIAVGELHYQYPQAGQLIRFQVPSDENQ